MMRLTRHDRMNAAFTTKSRRTVCFNNDLLELAKG